jgi:hypothetical protein
MLGFVWDFKRLCLFVIIRNWFWFFDLGVCNEINSGLFNEYDSCYINFIVKLKISVNMEEFEFL